MFEYDPINLNPAQLDTLDRSVEQFMNGEIKKNNPCGRCNGKGELKNFVHILGGICFRCWGTGEELTHQERINAGNIAKKTLRVFNI